MHDNNGDPTALQDAQLNTVSEILENYEFQALPLCLLRTQDVIC